MSLIFLSCAVYRVSLVQSRGNSLSVTRRTIDVQVNVV